MNHAREINTLQIIWLLQSQIKELALTCSFYVSAVFFPLSLKIVRIVTFVCTYPNSFVVRARASNYIPELRDPFSSLLFKPLLLYRILYFTVTLTELIMLSSLAFSAVPLLLAGLHATAVGAIPSISAVGSKFFYENGTQFYIKGT